MKVYGRIERSDGWWHILCEPHVALRFKRVFPKVRSDRVGWLSLADTPENSRDLEWFIARYPLRVDNVARLREQSIRFTEQQNLVDKLLAGAYRGALNYDMALPPRDYQKVAAEMCVASGSLLLADDVGLGKSVSAIAAFLHKTPIYVTTLTHLCKQWKDFFSRFAPHLRVHILKRVVPYDVRTADGSFPDVVIGSYHKLAGWAETLGPVIKSIVWDEAQELRHAETKKYEAARYLCEHAPFRMGLSATPIYNYGGEMFNVLECIRPGALGSRSEFLTEWCLAGESIANPKAFGSYLRDSGLMLRRTRKDVGRELPELSVMVHQVESDNSKFNDLGSDCEALARTILAKSEDFRGQKMQASAEFDMRMRQATGIAKAPYVSAFVRMLLEQEEPVILYGWHRVVYGIWLEALSAFNPVLYTGSESPTQKEKAKSDFVCGRSKVMLISLRAGQGLDGLQQACKTVVFGELDWSPGVHEQCIGRINRDGQKYPVFAYYLVSNQGSDPVVSDTCGLKTIQIEGIRNPSHDLIEKLSVDPKHIKKLAQSYLAKIKPLREPEAVSA